MRGALGGPRVLLRRLREVMAEPVSAQERLNKIVVLIAANMVAEVCSVYVLRVDGTLELYASEGLKPEAVHVTVLGQDEGLVGLVSSEAKSLNLSDAQHHPAFSFRPETGEEIYHSFLGVPILRAGNTLGVLVVQNRARALLFGRRGGSAPDHRDGARRDDRVGRTLRAREARPGAGRAPAAPARGPVDLRRHRARPCGAARAARRRHQDHRRRSAEGACSASTPRSTRCAPISTGCSNAATSPTAANIATCSKPIAMFANDRGWTHKMHEAVMTGLTAEAAVERVQSDNRARMLRQTDPYLRERLHDLDDLANRLMRQLVGRDHAPTREQLPDNAILVARAMGPAALLDYDRKKLRALVLEEGGPTSHVSIVARALGIAAVGQIANATGIVDPGDAIIVDGTMGHVYVRPTADVEKNYADRVRLRARRQAQYAELRDKPCVTKDGEKIALMLNAGLLVDLPHIAETGATGIGLFRTELQFMVVARDAAH